MVSSRRKFKIPHAKIILLSIIGMILIGAILLSLPVARTIPISFLDAFFTSTSSTCLTGLFTVPLTSYTLFGQSVIMALMQIGGLGIITLTLFLIYIIGNLGMSTQLLAGQILELEVWKDIKKFLIFIIASTLFIELLGASIFFITLNKEYHLSKAIFLSLFHSISSFCNAGITLFPNGMSAYSKNLLMLLPTAFMIISGGLSFLTWYELVSYIRSFRGKRHFHFSLHSKVVLFIAVAILLITTTTYWLLEYKNGLAQVPFFKTFFNAFFNAASSSSSGFSTVNFTLLQPATIFLILVVSFIGTAPGSTGSGIKTTTFAIFLATIKATLTDRTSVEIWGRRIPKDQVNKAIAVTCLSLGWIAILIFSLLIVEKTWSFLDVVVEALSSFTNLGISMGKTQSLTQIGKIIVIISMIVGRIGSLTLALALTRRTETTEYSYPEERVMIG